MGTETYYKIYVTPVTRSPYVKLNNPLMGTETYNLYHICLQCFQSVKLNNPLMGTETARNKDVWNSVLLLSR